MVVEWAYSLAHWNKFDNNSTDFIIQFQYALAYLSSNLHIAYTTRFWYDQAWYVPCQNLISNDFSLILGDFEYLI